MPLVLIGVVPGSGLVGTYKNSSSWSWVNLLTVVCIKVHKIASIWCKTALGEVGMSLPWWCAAFVLLSPGYWSLFLNLKKMFIMEKWRGHFSHRSKLKLWNFSSFTLWNLKFQLWPMEKWPEVIINKFFKF